MKKGGVAAALTTMMRYESEVRQYSHALVSRINTTAMMSSALCHASAMLAERESQSRRRTEGEEKGRRDCAPSLHAHAGTVALDTNSSRCPGKITHVLEGREGEGNMYVQRSFGFLLFFWDKRFSYSLNPT
jgi:hypothetical protein